MSERWQYLIRLCFLRFGMSVSDFWQMTFPEFNELFSALANDPAREIPNRKRLIELMQKHPDNATKTKSDNPIS